MVGSVHECVPSMFPSISDVNNETAVTRTFSKNYFSISEYPNKSILEANMFVKTVSIVCSS